MIHTIKTLLFPSYNKKILKQLIFMTFKLILHKEMKMK